MSDLAQIFAALEALKPEALAHQAKTAQSLAGSYSAILKRYVVAFIEGEGSIVDARARKWAISFSLVQGQRNRYRTEFRRVVRNHGSIPNTVDMGRYDTVSGLDGAARHISALCIANGAPLDLFSEDALARVLKNLRGPISRGRGRAEMHYVRDAERAQKSVLGEWRNVTETWTLDCTVCKLDIAPPRPKGIKIRDMTK